MGTGWSSPVPSIILGKEGRLYTKGEKQTKKPRDTGEKERERERERKTDDDHTNVSMHHIFMHIYLSFISMHLDAFHSYTPHIEDRNIQLDILFV